MRPKLPCTILGGKANKDTEGKAEAILFASTVPERMSLRVSRRLSGQSRLICITADSHSRLVHTGDPSIQVLEES